VGDPGEHFILTTPCLPILMLNFGLVAFTFGSIVQEFVRVASARSRLA
jgi:hypothetical protein